MAQTANDANNKTFSNSFTYDGLERLITATSTGTPPLFASESYSFDTLGRMTSRTVGGTVRPYSYDPAHIDAPTSYNGVSYTYDANGSQVGTNAGQSRTFDPEGRLSSVSNGTGSTSAFVYNANGSRILKAVTAGGSTTRTLYVGAYEEQLGSGSINYYSFGGKGVGLRRSGWPSGNGQYRLVGDHLGSTTLLVDTAIPPTVVQRQYHKPYGEIAWQWTLGGSLTDVGFTGQRLDSDSGLMYYGARFYDPALGYFASADTMGVDKGASQSRNRYAYVLNNPLNHTDPTGHCTDDDDCTHTSHPTLTPEEQRANATAELAEYGIFLRGTWPLEYLLDALQGVRDLAAAAGWSPTDFRNAMGGHEGRTTLFVYEEHYTVGEQLGGADERRNPSFEYYDGILGQNHNVIAFIGSAMRSAKPEDRRYRVVHELAHAWDSSSHDHLGYDLAHTTHSQWIPTSANPNNPGYKYAPGDRAVSGYYTNEQEDFAESVAATVYPHYSAFVLIPGLHGTDSRINFVQQQFQNYR